MDPTLSKVGLSRTVRQGAAITSASGKTPYDRAIDIHQQQTADMKAAQLERPKVGLSTTQSVKDGIYTQRGTTTTKLSSTQSRISSSF